MIIKTTRNDWNVKESSEKLTKKEYNHKLAVCKRVYCSNLFVHDLFLVGPKEAYKNMMDAAMAYNTLKRY